MIVMGGTGHVGGAVARALLARGEPVTVVSRDAAAAIPSGADVVRADIADVDTLRAAFRLGRRAFLLNPPAAPVEDTDTIELQTAQAIVAALRGSGLEHVVAQSTYGAQSGEAIGDLGSLYRFEQLLLDQPIPVTIVRSAYLMSDWDAQLASARDDGRIDSLFPADLAIPMVSPDDVGAVAAGLLLQPEGTAGLVFVEGPARYTSADVAAAFGRALGREVELKVVPRERWVASFEALRFSPPAARSYAGMTALSVDHGVELPTDPVRGGVTLDDYLERLVAG